jgi:Fis family transcriptional regulator
MNNTSAVGRAIPLNGLVRSALQQYFDDLEGHEPNDLYQLLLSEVERPLLETVMQYVGGNQTRAAQALGINRGTLRKKLKQYGLDN